MGLTTLDKICVAILAILAVFILLWLALGNLEDYAEMQVQNTQLKLSNFTNK